MLILDQFKQAALTEKIATLTSTVILIGISYKLGYYFTRLLGRVKLEVRHKPPN